MCCTPEQIGSNPNHNIGADVSTLNQHTHTHTLFIPDLYTANLSWSLNLLLTVRDFACLIWSWVVSAHSANWGIISHTLSYPLNTSVFCGASGKGRGRVHFHRPTKKLYPLAPLIHNLLIFAFRRNPSHICKCMTTENKPWHRWCAQSLKLNTRGGN